MKVEIGTCTYLALSKAWSFSNLANSFYKIVGAATRLTLFGLSTFEFLSTLRSTFYNCSALLIALVSVFCSVDMW